MLVNDVVYAGCRMRSIIYGVSVFFFKQKTAYEMLRSLVGSEMCIRDRATFNCSCFAVALSEWALEWMTSRRTSSG